MIFEHGFRGFEAISQAPLSRDTLFFYIQLAVSRRRMYEMIFNNKFMRGVVRAFLTFPAKNIGRSLTYEELPVRKLFIFVQRSFIQHLRLLG